MAMWWFDDMTLDTNSLLWVGSFRTGRANILRGVEAIRCDVDAKTLGPVAMSLSGSRSFALRSLASNERKE